MMIGTGEEEGNTKKIRQQTREEVNAVEETSSINILLNSHFVMFNSIKRMIVKKFSADSSTRELTYYVIIMTVYSISFVR